jgi:hypothetical protein
MTQPLLPSLYTREEIWQRFATEIGADYTPGDFWTTEQIRATIAPWTILLTLSKEDPKVACTHLTARYHSPDGFTFTCFQAGTFADVGHLKTAAEIVVGDTTFDHRFRIAGDPIPQAGRLFRNPAIRRYLMAIPHIGLSAEPVPAIKACSELSCMVIGAVATQERLLALVELMAETLQHLCTIGSATEEPCPR